ncbi:MAG TPA: hypothetical protein VF174_08795 [Micromonosporaceae bacterium]
MTQPNLVEVVVRVKDETQPGFKAVEQQATKLGSSFKRVGEIAGGMLLAQGIQAGAQRAMALMQSTVKAASDLGESINAVQKTFGEASGAIENFGKTSAEQVGLSTRAFNQMATPLGAILKNQGLDIRSVATETINLTKRAADMASVFNTDVNEALFAIQAGLRGETEPLRRYGVTLSEVSIQQQAMAMTGKTAANQLTAQEKALARLSLIYAQSASTAGDFQDTVDGLANSQRVSAAQIENAKAAIGTAYLPIAAKAAQVTGELANVFGALPGPAQIAIAAIAAIGVAAVLGAGRLMAFHAAMDTLAAKSPVLARGLGLVVSALTKLTLVLAGLTIAREIAREFGVLNDVLGAVPGIGDNLVQAYGDTTSSLKKLESQTTNTWVQQRTMASTIEELIEAGDNLVTVWDKLHGAEATLHEKTLAARDAIASLRDTFKENKFSVDENTDAGLRNITTLEGIARKAADAAQAYLDQTGDAEGAKKMMDQFRVAAEKSIGATGAAARKVHELAAELFKLPEFREITVRANIVMQGQGQLNRAIKDLERLGHGGFAHGGISGAAGGGPRGSLTWVGEQGPELVRLPYGSTVYPTGQSMNMASQMSGGTQWAAPLVVNGGGFGQMAFDWLANEVRRRGGQLAVLGLKAS